MVLRLIIIFALITSLAQAQDDNISDFLIRPGDGIGTVKLGDNYDELINTLSKPSKIRSFDGTCNYYSQFGENFKNHTFYKIGFDTAVVYENGDDDYLFYSLYFKNKKLVCIFLSTFPYRKAWYKKFSINFDIRFLMTSDDIIKRYGDDYKILNYSEGNNIYYCISYLKRGITFIFFKYKLRCMEIYHPIDN